MPEQEPLINLLIACTVRVETHGTHGTGFFVSPGLILTCAHVIHAASGHAAELVVYCNDTRQTEAVIEIVVCLPQPYPDLALLRIGREDHPCVYLDPSIKIDARMFTFGYSARHAKGDSLTLKYEGPMYLDADQVLYKLEEGQVEPGFSGAPLLNFDTGGVCGLIKLTRDPAIDLGGGAVPTKIVVQKLPDIEALNQEFHHTDLRWLEAREKLYPSPPATTTVSAALWVTTNDAPLQSLLGRDRVAAEIRQQLDATKRISLVGLGGMGKTALALHIARQYLALQHGRVIWLQADAGPSNMLAEALAECLGKKSTIVSQIGIAQVTALRQILNEAGLALVVVDDAQNGVALHDLLQSVPVNLPVLITSRQRMGAIPTIEINELSPDNGLELLSHYAAQVLTSDPDAAHLCQLLGYHPYALELAGTTLKVNLQTPGELYKQLDKAPHELAAPGGYAAAGHESLTVLLDQSVNSLDVATRKIFTAFGGFSTSGATSNLLALYLARRLEEIQQLLGELVRRSLVKRRPTTNYYYLHDLTFSYAQGRFKADKGDPRKIVAIIETYVSVHAQDYEQIGLDLSNILGAAAIASDDVLVRIMSWITVGGYPAPQGRSYFDERGHTVALLEKMDQAIAAAARIDHLPPEIQHYLLSKRGNAYFDRRDFDHAIETYRLALSIAPGDSRRVVLLAVIGQAFAEKQQDAQADHYLQQAYDLAKLHQDDASLSFVLEHKSWCAGHKRDFAAARQFAADAVEINRRLKNPTRLGYSLLNLGSAELDLGNAAQALVVHDEALTIAQSTGNLQLIADVCHALGEDYDNLGDIAQAQIQLNRALHICQQTGDIEHEARLVAFMDKHKYAA